MAKKNKGSCSTAGRNLATRRSSQAGRDLSACRSPADPDMACRVAGWRLSVLGSSRAADVLSHCSLSRVRNPGGADRRKLSVIAREISADWKDVYFGAEPYLREMGSLDSVNDYAGQDSGSNVVLYFLANAGKWRGPTAKRVKNELREMVGLRVVKNPGGRDDDDDGDGFDGFDEEPVECPMCSGPAGLLGTLGSVEHCQCRNCGWEFAREEVVVVVLEERGNPGGVSPRLTREGTEVEFRPTGASAAMYSSMPDVGERGKTTSLPTGSGRKVYVPGPGGGLVYVDWDRSGTQGVAPGDLVVVRAAAPRQGAAPSGGAPSRAPAATREAYGRARYELLVTGIDDEAHGKAVARAVCGSGRCYYGSDGGDGSVDFRYDTIEGLRAGYAGFVEGMNRNGWRVSWSAKDVRTGRSVLDQLTARNPGVTTVKSRTVALPGSADVSELEGALDRFFRERGIRGAQFFNRTAWVRRHPDDSSALGGLTAPRVSPSDVERMEEIASGLGFRLGGRRAPYFSFYEGDAARPGRPADGATEDPRGVAVEREATAFLKRENGRAGRFYNNFDWAERNGLRRPREFTLVLSDPYAAGAISLGEEHGQRLEEGLASIAKRNGMTMELRDAETIEFFYDENREPGWWYSNETGRVNNPRDDDRARR